MKNKCIYFLFFLFSLNCSFAQTVIKGKATSFKGEKIEWLTYADFITKTYTPLSSAVIDSNGVFELKTDLDYTRFGILKIGSLKASLHIEPNKTYYVQFPVKDSIQFGLPWLQLHFDSLAKEDLNALIKEFNSHHDHFLSTNYMLFLKHAAKSLVDSFKININDHFNPFLNEKNAYFNTYVKYSIAILEQSNNISNTLLFKNYLESLPVLYNHPVYMDFFTQFYKKYFLQYSLSKEGQDIIPSVNTKMSYRKVMELLEKDHFLKEEKIRELVFIQGLYEVYNHPSYEKKSVRFLLTTISQSSPFQENKKIAQNILSKLTKLSVGTKAPSFTLLNQNNEVVSLNDFKGKYVYLDFWATWCIPCLQEIQLIPSLVEKYGDQIEFVSISIDKEFDTMKNFLNKSKYIPKQLLPHWTFLHFENTPTIKEDYEIIALPTCFLIDPNGFLFKSPAERPSENIEDIFLQIKNDKQRKY